LTEKHFPATPVAYRGSEFASIFLVERSEANPVAVLWTGFYNATLQSSSMHLGVILALHDVFARSWLALFIDRSRQKRK
jgi:hypothetical protein